MRSSGGLPDGTVVSLYLLAVVLVLTTYTEIQSARIPNWITLPALAAAFVVSFVGLGIPFVSCLFGFLTGFGFLFLFYLFGGMGGGDVKLMGVVGALLGFPDILPVLMYTAFIGGGMALLALIWNRRFWSGLRESLGMFFTVKEGQTLDPVEENEAGGVAARPLTIPYGLAIVAGCLVHVLIGAEGFPG
ncbi:MAG: prepilin peptidase [Verrucomicrobia bacterium]|nr:prepilin peptidase [Kiritimatiellia bacterium]MCP5488407.1 prepilin peptidase [Verrucomicrobiota bacterium]